MLKREMNSRTEGKKSDLVGQFALQGLNVQYRNRQLQLEGDSSESVSRGNQKGYLKEPEKMERF